MISELISPSTVSLRFSDIRNGADYHLTPLKHHYENRQTISLEEATDPLISIVQKVKQMVKLAMQHVQDIDDSLPLDQRASIALYSLAWSPKESAFYYVLNSVLRSPDRDKTITPWLPFLELFMTALNALPSIDNQIVYRGVNSDLRKDYAIDSPTVLWGFSSCTLNIGVLENAEFFGTSGSRTLFLIETSTGKDIHKFSFYPDEQEILLLDGQKLEVVGHWGTDDGLTTIQMKEIPSSQPTSSEIPDPSKPDIKLSYANFDLTDRDVSRVISEALADKTCTALDLSSNHITDQGIIPVANVLQENEVRHIYGRDSKRK